MVVGADEDDTNDSRGFFQRYILDDDAVWIQSGDPVVGDLGDNMCRLPIQISSSGLRVAVGTGNGLYVKVFDWEDSDSQWNLVKKFSEGNSGKFGHDTIRLSRDGRFLAFGDESFDGNRGRLFVYQWINGKFLKIGTFLGPEERSYYGYAFDISDDGSKLAVVDYDGVGGTIIYHRLGKGKKTRWVIKQKIPGNFAGIIEFARNGEYLAIGYSDFNDGAGKVDLYMLK